MRCTFPRTVGFKADGKTLAWSQKDYSKEYQTFQLPCGKCIECRLDYARQWAIRCVHEAQMHENNIFVTLTYSDKNLVSPKLDYTDFQLFMKRLRKTQNDPIGVFVTGEYGEKTKRPHWHAILFNFRPRDAKPFRNSPNGDQVYTSDHLEKLWGKGFVEFGSVTFESAGYVARYAAKKLVHGKDDEHEYQPISKKSSKNAIGKKWLERFWPDVFHHGSVVLPDGTKSSIPRYYEKWLKQHHPQKWLHYVTQVKSKLVTSAKATESEKKLKWVANHNRRRQKYCLAWTPTENEVRRTIQDQKFKMLQSYLKL